MWRVNSSSRQETEKSFRSSEEKHEEHERQIIYAEILFYASVKFSFLERLKYRFDIKKDPVYGELLVLQLLFVV